MNPRLYILSAALAVFTCATMAAPVSATAMPQARTVQDGDWCDRDYSDDESERFCEVREATLEANRNVINVDAGPNGGVRVVGTGTRFWSAPKYRRAPDPSPTPAPSPRRSNWIWAVRFTPAALARVRKKVGRSATESTFLTAPTWSSRA